MSYSKYAGREGEKFYRLTLLEGFKHNAYYKYKCLCDCGNVVEVYAHNLIEGAQRTSKSCGCYKREKVKQTMTTHGYNSNGKIKREYGNELNLNLFILPLYPSIFIILPLLPSTPIIINSPHVRRLP